MDSHPANPAGCPKEEFGGTDIASRSPSDDSRGQSVTDCLEGEVAGKKVAEDADLKRTKLFSLFQSKDKRRSSAEDPSARISGHASVGPSSGTTSKRPTRSLAAKSRQTTLVPLPMEELDEEWIPSATGSSSRSKKSSLKQQQPLIRVKSPLPPLNLNVSGNGLAAGQAAHSFFDKRTTGNVFQTNGSSAPNDRIPRSRCVEKRMKATSIAPWPLREAVHVLPPDHVSLPFDKTTAALSLPFGKIDRKSRKEARCCSEEPLTYPSNGIAQAVRVQQRQPQASSMVDHHRCQDLLSPESLLASLPVPLQTHPAFLSGIHRLKARSVAQKANIIWTERWRPHASDEVLGNELSAIYLRDWLSELKLASDVSASNTNLQDSDDKANSQKKRRVQTSVSRIAKRGKATHSGMPGEAAGDASFIADDEEEEIYDFFQKAGLRTAPHTDAEIDDLACGFADGSPNQGAPQTILDFRSAHRFTNCIVLYGPPGAGKTSAVFACADELSFEVFELFPGVGRRGAKELKEAVGALGRNHMVSGGGSGGGAKGGYNNPFKTMMSSSGTSDPNAPPFSAGTEGRMFIESSNDSHEDLKQNRHDRPTRAIPPKYVPTAPRQSLILIEEADLLFEDDRAFWGGIVDLVRSSKRPVILTCNDLSYIPQDLLSIQEVLPFQLLERSLALQYLSFISGAEGSPRTVNAIERLLHRNRTDSTPPQAERTQRSLDLRQAIHQLQFASSTCEESSPTEDRGSSQTLPPVEDGDDELSDLQCLRHLSSAFSSLSFAQAELCRPFVRQCAGDEPSVLGRYSPLDASEKASNGQLETSSSVTSNVIATSYGGTTSTCSPDEMVIPAGSGLTTLTSQPNARASPVALPLQGGEDTVQQEVEERSSIAMKRALRKHVESANYPSPLEVQHSYIVDLHTQAEHLWSMLTPLFVPSLPLPPPEPSTRQHYPLGKLPIAAEKFWLDYAPYVRLMVRIEDFEEVVRQYAAQQDLSETDRSGQMSGAGISGVRSLRPSTRLTRAAAAQDGNLERIMPLNKEGLEAARKSGSGLIQLLWSSVNMAGDERVSR